MLISIYSVFISLIIFNLWVAALIYFERNNEFIKFFGIKFLFALSLVCIFRMVFAIELPFTQVIRSDRILPPIMNALNYKFLNILGVRISLLRIGIIILCAVLLYGLFDFARQMYYYKKFIDAFQKEQWEIPDEIRMVYDRVVKELNFKHPPLLICNDMSNIPFATGFIKPMIFIPPLLSFSEEDLENIFKHELTHLKNKDICVKLMCSIFCSLMWWNPLVHILKQDISQILEIKCDLTVCDDLSLNQRVSYLRAIIDLIGTMPRKVKAVYYTSAMTKENERCLIQRFKLVLEEDAYHSSKKVKFLSFAALILTVILSYSFVFQPYYQTSPDTVNTSREVYFTNENTRVVFDEGVYKVYLNDEYVFDADEDMLESFKMAEISVEGQ